MEAKMPVQCRDGNLSAGGGRKARLNTGFETRALDLLSEVVDGQNGNNGRREKKQQKNQCTPKNPAGYPHVFFPCRRTELGLESPFDAEGEPFHLHVHFAWAI